MAGIITPQFGFRNATVDHSPSPLSFGFGLASAAAVPGWQPPGMQNASSFSPAPSTVGNSSKPAQKRRHEDADGDEAMDRSPTPEKRPIRPMKRIASHRYPHRTDEGDKENRRDTTGGQGESDVDVGMLLGEPTATALRNASTDRPNRSESTFSVAFAHSYLPSLDASISQAHCSFSYTQTHFGYRSGCCQSSGEEACGRIPLLGINHQWSELLTT